MRPIDVLLTLVAAFDRRNDEEKDSMLSQYKWFPHRIERCATMRSIIVGEINVIYAEPPRHRPRHLICINICKILNSKQCENEQRLGIVDMRRK